MNNVVKGVLIRGESTELGTPGMLLLDNEFECDTLELPWKDNERGKSCVKPDEYRGRVWWSPHMNRPVIRFDDQNGREDLEIHPGNIVEQIHGCTLVGHGYGDVRLKDGSTHWGVLNSGATLNALIMSLEIPMSEHLVTPAGFISGYKEVLITYKWGANCEPNPA